MPPPRPCPHHAPPSHASPSHTPPVGGSRLGPGPAASGNPLTLGPTLGPCVYLYLPVSHLHPTSKGTVQAQLTQFPQAQSWLERVCAVEPGCPQGPLGVSWALRVGAGGDRGRGLTMWVQELLSQADAPAWSECRGASDPAPPCRPTMSREGSWMRGGALHWPGLGLGGEVLPAFEQRLPGQAVSTLFLVTGIGVSLSCCGQLGPACPLGSWRTWGQSCAGEAEVHLCFREVGGQHRPSRGDSWPGGASEETSPPRASLAAGVCPGG